jgi:hypothetical protein
VSRRSVAEGSRPPVSCPKIFPISPLFTPNLPWQESFCRGSGYGVLVRFVMEVPIGLRNYRVRMARRVGMLVNALSNEGTVVT